MSNRLEISKEPLDSPEMHQGAGRRALGRVIQAQKGADTLQRAVISDLLDWSGISHMLVRACGPISFGGGAQHVKPQGKEQT